jgi:hypothetical protein
MATDATVVSIYAQGEDGTTGPWVGSGLLLAPDLVVVHPPLDEELGADGDGPGLRVGIATPDGLVEVLDVVRTHVATGSTGHDVALELSGPSAAPTPDLPRTAAKFRVALGTLLDGVTFPRPPVPPKNPRPGPQPPPPGPRPRNERPPWCKIWPSGPGCRRP